MTGPIRQDDQGLANPLDPYIPDSLFREAHHLRIPQTPAADGRRCTP